MNMKRLLIIICLFVWTNAIVKAQNVNFRSPIFESYVKKHVGIGDTEKLNTTQLDTIRQIDLSGLDLTDISDVKFLTNVRSIDLSNNKIEDIAPLATLDSLCEVNLSHNNLKSISRLSFSYARKMYVNVAFNDIKDFSCFNTLTNCCFTIAGVDMQYDKERSFYDVDYLVCNIRLGQPYVYCRINSNTGAKALLTLNNEKIDVPTDRSRFEYKFKSNITGATPIYLKNGEYIDSAYIVPADYYNVDGGNTITLKTGLPEDYVLSTVNAQYGNVVIVGGNTIKYTAPNKAVPDKIDFCYSQRGTIKGISCFYMNQDKGEKGDVNVDGFVNAADILEVVKYIMDKPSNKINEMAADVNEDKSVNAADIVAIVNISTNSNVGQYAEAVDLGLPSGTLWASCNVGATKPEEVGGYYAWGETVEKSDYTQENYLYDGQNIGSDISGTNYDVAHDQLGGNWKMPTLKQIEELKNKCSHEVSQLNGVKGMKFTGHNGNSIFMPFTVLDEMWGDFGSYWSSTYNVNNDNAYNFFIDNDGSVSCLDSYRNIGRAVRPVETSFLIPPSITITPKEEEIHFGAVKSGTSKTETFMVTNSGITDLAFHIDGSTQFTNHFEVSDNLTSYKLLPGESKIYTVTAHGMNAGYEASTIIFVKSDNSDEETKVKLTAVGDDDEPLIDKSSLSLVVGEKGSIKVKTPWFQTEHDNESVVDGVGGGPGETLLGDKEHESSVSHHQIGLTYTALKVGVDHITFIDNYTNKTAVLTITVTE